jgi:PAS domain S-box-containing protein
MSSVLQIVSKLWPSTIRAQLILGIMVVHLFLMSIFVFDLVRRQRAFLKKQNREQVNNFVNQFAANSTTYIIANDFDLLERFALYHTNFPNLRYAMILSPDGIVLAHTNKNYVGKKPVDNISLQLAGPTTAKTLVENDQLLDLAVPVFAYNNLLGWVRVGVGQEHIQNYMSSIVRNGIVYILVAIFIGILFAILIGNRLTAGLHKLISTAEKIESGDRNVRAAPLKNRDFSNLGTAFNKMLDEIALSESMFRSAFDDSAIGMALVLPDGKFLRINKELSKIVGRTEEELLALTFQDITYPEDLEEDMSYLRQTLNGKINSYQMQKRYFHKGGHLVWAHLNVSLVRDGQGNPLFFVSQIEDITERKKSEARINQAVTDAQERERQEISMELHDNVNQLLAGCSFNIAAVEMIVKEEKATAVLGKIKDNFREAMEELRRISHQLAPSTHEWISLEEKIRAVVDTMNARKAIKVRYHFDELHEDIKAEVQLAMYRIIQEQFTNILKHAKASLVIIVMQRRESGIHMSIEDNGVGFDAHLTKKGIGLENIKRRVQAFNGSLSIQALAGKGCKLDIQFPVD